MASLSDFIGRFHPLLVHLPIGFLLIAVVFIWIKETGRAVKISIGLGALAAIGSVITGLLLASSEGYNDEVSAHKWSGIALAAVSVSMWFIPEQHLKLGSVVMTVLIFLTGHFGGTLTHGSLIAEPEAESFDLAQVDVSSAMFYDDAVKPILEARCYSCHNGDKQKGGLRLDSPEAINKGGKNGKIVTPGNPEESDLVHRIELPLDDEDHMPPKERKQLTEQEMKLISLWVAVGADFGKTITEALDAKQLASLSAGSGAMQLVPDVDVPEPDEALILKFAESNVAITRVAAESNLLQVNFITVPDEAGPLLFELQPLAKNVVWLKLNNANIDKINLSEFTNLTDLSLLETKVDDGVIEEILKCKLLVRLNLSGTKVTDISKLAALKDLKYLNVYNTLVKEGDLPGVIIERGNYQVPTLQTDTTVVKTN